MGAKERFTTITDEEHPRDKAIQALTEADSILYAVHGLALDSDDRPNHIDRDRILHLAALAIERIEVAFNAIDTQWKEIDRN